MLKNAHRYVDRPEVACIVLSFNHRQHVARLVERLRWTACREILVCEDGSIDGSLQSWEAALVEPNEFVLRSNDLHEIRAYNRAAKYSNADVLCFLQDDDIPPEDPGWLDDALRLFRRFPDLVVLGGWVACRSFEEHPKSPGDLSDQYEPAELLDVDGIPFRFVEMVNVGPYFVRRGRFLEMGGFDQGYSDVGWPGIHFDFEFCLRAWGNGAQTGWFGPSIFGNTGDPGTKVFGHHDKRIAQRVENFVRLRGDYEQRIGEIAARVEQANQLLGSS